MGAQDSTESSWQKPSDDEIKAIIADAVHDESKTSINFDDFLTLMTHPEMALAQVFADRMDALSAEVVLLRIYATLLCLT